MGYLSLVPFDTDPLTLIRFFFVSYVRCDPCVEAGPDLSELADHYRHRGNDMAVIGINNESIFGVTKPADIDLLRSFLEANQDGFRYTILVDNDEGYAKNSMGFFVQLFEMEGCICPCPTTFRSPLENEW